MRNYFNLKEFSREDIPGHAATKILDSHIPTLNAVRTLLGVPLSISGKSGFRSAKTEKKNGRSGNSQHCFKGRGAVDLTCSKMGKLLRILKDISTYTRITYYPNKNFIHCDFKPVTGNKRQFFIDRSDGKGWKFQNNVVRNKKIKR